MGQVRNFFMRHRVLAILVVMAALSMKMIVPTGFMIAQDAKVFTVQLCHDGSGDVLTKQLVIPMKGEPGGKPSGGECPFAGAASVSIAAADALLLALALAFILTLGFGPVRRARPERVFHLRPPLRGPPAFA